MKHCFSALAGALAVSGAILWAGGRSAHLFAAGFATALLCVGLALPVILPHLRGKNRKVTRSKKPVRIVRSKRSKPMLSPVQQDVLSALMNQGLSFTQAEKAVLSVSDLKQSGFDELFREAVRVAVPGKGRAA